MISNISAINQQYSAMPSSFPPSQAIDQPPASSVVQISTKGLLLNLNGNQEGAFHGMVTPPKPQTKTAAAYTNIVI